MASMPPMLPAMPQGELPPLSGGPMDLGDFSTLGALPPAEPEPESAIHKLKPGSELHSKTLGKLQSMFRYSESAMSQHTARWGWMEQKIQAYIALPDYKQLMDTLANNRGAAPEPVKVIVPYSYATIHAAATFLASVLLGRRPVFPLMATSGTTVDKARYMETALQANIEASKGYEVLWQFIWDSLIYGFGATRIGWEERRGKVIQINNGQREVITSLKYAGNKLHAVDPYMLRPDPRVPMHEVAEKGDFCFWITQQSRMILKDMEKAGVLKWVDKATEGGVNNTAANTEMGPVSDSQRRARLGNAGGWTPAPSDLVGFFPVREGTVRLVAKDWNLGDSDVSELWKFSWINNKQIIQAEPLGHVHEKHPVAITEPTTFGHEFGSLSMSDMIGPFQDIISWLVNSRITGVRASQNSSFIVDPARIEMQDLRTPPEGKTIRLKQAAMGTNVQEAIRQFVVHDTTTGHVNDIQMLRMLADSITGINDNMRGIQAAGNRKSATEARMSMQAGASRLSQIAVRISSQGFMGLAEQMISNIQQFMPDEMWVEMTGDDGLPVSSLLTPDLIMGTFNYQISDGSLPYDKMALIEVWKEILFGVAKDPELRGRKDLVKIFDYVAELGGAKNIRSFDKQQAPQMGPEMGAPPEGAVPVGGAMPPAPAAVAGALM